MSDQNDKSGSNDQDDIDALLEGALRDMPDEAENRSDSAMDFDIDDILSAVERPADIDTADTGADFDIDDILNATAETTVSPAEQAEVATQDRDPRGDLDVDGRIDGAADSVTAPIPAAGTMPVPGAPPSADSIAGMDILSGGALATPSSTPVPDADQPTEHPVTTDESTPLSSHLVSGEIDIDDIMADMNLDEDEPISTGDKQRHNGLSATDDALIADTGELADVTPGQDLPGTDGTTGHDEIMTEGVIADEAPAPAGPEPVTTVRTGVDTGTGAGITVADGVPATKVSTLEDPSAEELTDESLPNAALSKTDNDQSRDGLETLDISLALGDMATAPRTADEPGEIVEEAVPGQTAREEEAVAASEPEAATRIPTLTDVVMTGEAYRAAMAEPTRSGDIHALLGEVSSQAVRQALHEVTPAIEKAVLEHLRDSLPSLIQQAIQDQANHRA